LHVTVLFKIKQLFKPQYWEKNKQIRQLRRSWKQLKTKQKTNKSRNHLLTQRREDCKMSTAQTAF
jgi:hypothetical protein